MELTLHLIILLLGLLILYLFKKSLASKLQQLDKSIVTWGKIVKISEDQEGEYIHKNAIIEVTNESNVTFQFRSGHFSNSFFIPRVGLNKLVIYSIDDPTGTACIMSYYNLFKYQILLAWLGFTLTIVGFGYISFELLKI